MTTDPPVMRPANFPAVLPVIDIRGGKVMWGVAGRRESYQPLRTPLADGCGPLAVAQGLRRVVGHDVIYVADLDAIQHDAPHWDVVQTLAKDGFRPIVDAGLREPSRAFRLVEIGAAAVVAALETLPDRAALSAIVEAIDGSRTIFSLDLKEGRVLGSTMGWGTDDPISLGAIAADTGVAGLIVLDLAGVGVGAGVPTVELCSCLRKAHRSLGLITGGGVRHLADVRCLLETGVDSVLVSTALHQGHIGPDEIAQLTGVSRNGSKRSGAC